MELAVGPAVQYNGLYPGTQLSDEHNTGDQCQCPGVPAIGAPQPEHISA